MLWGRRENPVTSDTKGPCSFCGQKGPSLFAKVVDSAPKPPETPDASPGAALKQTFCICAGCADAFKEKIFSLSVCAPFGSVVEQQTLDRLSNTPVQEREGRAVRRLPRPKDIRETLDRDVVGQDRAKKLLAVQLYNHYKRQTRRIYGLENAPNLSKTNVLIAGPTGSGKTFLVEKLADQMGVPFVSVDMTSFSKTGHTGQSVSDILVRLVEAAAALLEKKCALGEIDSVNDADIYRAAEKGIVYLDECDKIALKNNQHPNVQQDFLTILHGKALDIPARGNPSNRLVNIDTTNILFIAGGAFCGLENIKAERLKQGGIGFTAPLPGNAAADEETGPATEDLVAYGLLPEFVARFPVTVTLDPLDRSALVRILKEPRNALLRQYQALFKMDDIELVLTDDACEAVADIALAEGTGGRGLRKVMERLLTDPMFEMPGVANDTRIVISAATVRGEASARIETPSRISAQRISAAPG